MAERNYVLGAGRIRIALEDDDGVLGGERYVGNTPGFSVAVETENAELWDSDGPTAQKVEDVITQVTRSATLTINDIGAENLALFVVGDLETVLQAANEVEDEEVGPVARGLYYPLGITTLNPTGVRGAVTGMTVRDSVTENAIDAETTQEGVTVTNWEYDPDTGSLYVPDGSTIEPGTSLLVTYTPPANERQRIATSNLGAKFGSLRYTAANTRGKNRSLYAPRVRFAPTGEAPWKSRDTWMELQYSLEFLASANGAAALYIDDEPVATSGSA